MIDISNFKSAELPFRIFEEFSKIPRGSGNTKAIADYLVDFAERRGLFVYRDASDNVVIRKPATPGYENRPAIIFQGHMDIVAEKAQNVNIDMQNEGLSLYRDGDFLRARGTTLGADDGVAMAYALAVLDSDDIIHPEFEAVFTSDEEIGLLGAVALDASVLHGKMLINIDSDEEGIFTAGCAGGARVDLSIPVSFGEYSGNSYKLSLSGLRGGHSGVEIDKGRVNAIRAAAAALSLISDARLISFVAGNADNAIPRDAEIIFGSESLTEDNAARIVSEAKKFVTDEEDAVFTIERINFPSLALDVGASRNILSLITSLPNGVTRMSEDIPGLVETSLNMGIARLEDKNFALTQSVRSAKSLEKARLIEKIRETAFAHGATVSVRGEYPAWEYRSESHLRDVMCRVYSDMYGKDATVVTIHAGLECGIFSDKIAGLDCVSIGPDNYDIHTPEERLSLPSFMRVWEYLIEVLKNL